MIAEDIIDNMHLLPHPEGGFYKETYRSAESLVNSEGNSRNVSTAIYYLLQDRDKSHFHRIKSDELWFFHQGQTLEIVFIENGRLSTILLGNDLAKGEVFQACIPANTWFASKIKESSAYSLVSCTVAPGFDFADFEMAKRADLIEQYPDLHNTIIEFTREQIRA